MNFHDHGITGYNNGWEQKSGLQEARAEKDPKTMNIAQNSNPVWVSPSDHPQLYWSNLTGTCG